MTMNSGKTSTELWAVMNSVGEILWTRGGSSTAPRLMVYETKGKAEGALKNQWTEQVHGGRTTEIRMIYRCQEI